MRLLETSEKSSAGNQNAFRHGLAGEAEKSVIYGSRKTRLIEREKAWQPGLVGASNSHDDVHLRLWSLS